MKTVRNSKVGDLSLRLVQEDRAFIGLIFAADNSKKAQVEGTDADDVWRRLHDEAGKANPKYFGFDGARHASRASFPNGFHSKGYTNAERDYKIAAKQRLDETAPLERAVSEPGLGEATLAVFRATKAGELAELKPRDRIYVGAICLEVRRPGLRSPCRRPALSRRLRLRRRTKRSSRLGDPWGTAGYCGAGLDRSAADRRSRTGRAQ